MMHNKRDSIVPPGFRGYEQLFIALRRLEKAWLLQYDNGDHFVKGRDALDYTLRVRQFFDLYLKGIAATLWLTEARHWKTKGS